MVEDTNSKNLLQKGLKFVEPISQK